MSEFVASDTDEMPDDDGQFSGSPAYQIIGLRLILISLLWIVRRSFNLSFLLTRPASLAPRTSRSRDSLSTPTRRAILGPRR